MKVIVQILNILLISLIIYNVYNRTIEPYCNNELDKDEKLDHKVDPIAGKKPRTSIPSNSGRIKPGHQPT